MNPFQKAFEKITEIMEPSFWKDNVSSKEIQNTGFFHKISRTPQQQQRCMVQKSSEVYFETSMMSHAGLRATSLLFWVATTEN